MSLRINVLKNGIATAAQKSVRILDQLLLIPFYITAWGADYYGEWITLTIIPSMLSFSDFGFGSAAANTFVLKYASDQKQSAADVSKSAIFTITGLIVFGMVVSSIALVALNHFGFFDKLIIHKKDAIIAVSLMMLARTLSFYQQLFEAYYRAARKASLSINLVTAQSFCNLSMSALLLSFGANVIELSLNTLVVSAMFYVIYSWKARSILNLHKEYKGEVTYSQVKDIFKKGLGYLMSPVWQALYFQGTTFVVRLVLGPQAVTIFNTVRTLSRSANQAYSMINSSIFPELQYEIGAGNLAKARKLFRIAIGVTLMTATGGVIFLYLFGQPLYNAWTKNLLNPPDAMWNIFLIGIVFNAMWWTSGVVFRAVNKPYGMAIAGVISAAISVVSSYFLSQKYGLSGAALGSIGLDIIMALYVLPVSCRLIGERILTIPRKLFGDILALTKTRVAIERAR
ncbi:lipopolysaccharide biosynthesis protein [Telluribacter sp. SYSU D00476]|uniref:lipopolysaccharide biosynthesis protein n=1 Tax=Telluribacter sp. SYSU D00476 TaxID=2811430 RepID=UPI001FF2D520|nr:hypothetical protein [Telluribacter sp. SYSU D00476]